MSVQQGYVPKESESNAIADLLFEHCVRYGTSVEQVMTRVNQRLVNEGYRNLVVWHWTILDKGSYPHRPKVRPLRTVVCENTQCRNIFTTREPDQVSCSKRCGAVVSGIRRRARIQALNEKIQQLESQLKEKE